MNADRRLRSSSLTSICYFNLKAITMREAKKKHMSPPTFKRLFQEAEIAQFTPSELRRYEDSLKAYRDIKNSMETAKEQGIEIGKEQGIEIGKEQGIEIGKEQGVKDGIEKVAKGMKERGIDSETIAACTGLSTEEVEKL